MMTNSIKNPKLVALLAIVRASPYAWNALSPRASWMATTPDLARPPATAGWSLYRYRQFLHDSRNNYMCEKGVRDVRRYPSAPLKPAPYRAARVHAYHVLPHHFYDPSSILRRRAALFSIWGSKHRGGFFFNWTLYSGGYLGLKYVAQWKQVSNATRD